MVVTSMSAWKANECFNDAGLKRLHNDLIALKGLFDKSSKKDSINISVLISVPSMSITRGRIEILGN